MKRKTNNEFAKEFEDDLYRRGRAFTHMLNEGESNNIFNNVTLPDSEFKDRIIDLFLGEDWYADTSICNDQVNAVAFMEIYDNYHKHDFINTITKWFNNLI